VLIKGMVASDVALALQDLLGMELGMGVDPLSHRVVLVILATRAHVVSI